MQHYSSFDDYLQAARIDEELQLNNYRERIEVPEEKPDPIRVVVEEPKEEVKEEPKEEEEKPKKKQKAK